MESVIEMTDIGGPTLLYGSAAKGGQIVIVDPDDRDRVLDFLEDDGGSDNFVSELALKARIAVIQYQTFSAAFHAKTLGISREEFIEYLNAEKIAAEVFAEAA